MKTAILQILMLALAAAPARAAGDTVLKAMNDELKRTVERLRMDDLDRPYFVSYLVTDSTETEFGAVFGSPREEYSHITRDAAVDLRVGSPEFDNAWYAGQDFTTYLPPASPLSEEAGYDALRFSLWTVTDQAYKGALEMYSQKKAYRQNKNITENPGDLSPQKRLTLLEEEPAFAKTDPAALKNIVVRLSALFRKYPGIQGSQALLRRVLRTYRFVNSEGTSFRYYKDGLSLEIKASIQTAAGLRLGDEKCFYWTSPADMPPYGKLEAETEEFARGLSYLVSSSTSEPYLGPVLFEGQAAAEFLGQLFVNQVSFVRSPWADHDDWTKYYIAQGALTKKLGMRVLPAFMSVSDDPLKREYAGTNLLGYYPVDNEGVRPVPLELVKAGKLENFYMTRAPVGKRSESNGHARGFIREFPMPRPGNVFFSAQQQKRVPRAELKKELLRLAAENGLDYGVIVRRLDPWDTRDGEALLANPVLAFRVSVKDGSEAPIGDAEWSGVNFRALRDIMLVSDAEQVYNYYQPTPFLYTRGYVPASIAAPDALLVQELELKPTETKPDRKPYLPHPYFEGR
jgi:hypothetical protein